MALKAANTLFYISYFRYLYRLRKARTEVSTRATSGGTKDILNHPLDVYYLIKRFESTWPAVKQHVFDISASTGW
jgi:hypothetical protein